MGKQSQLLYSDLPDIVLLAVTDIKGRCTYTNDTFERNSQPGDEYVTGTLRVKGDDN